MYVYFLISLDFPEQTYIGSTYNLRQRLAQHNRGLSPHTSKFRPWKIERFIWFEDVTKARQFEKYIKTGSGRAFAKKHF